MRTTYPTNNWYVAASSGDLNGDGLLDLAAGGWFDAGIDVVFGQPDGSLAGPVHYPQGGGQALAIADIDGDGIADLVAPDLASDSLLLYKSPLDGGIPAPSIIAIPISGGDVSGLVAADLNGDGLLDLVWTSQQSGGFLSNLGRGKFGSSLPLAVQGGAFGGIVVVDLNGDGHPDIAVNGSSLYLILSQLDGGYPRLR
jgi:hypothetical protein